MAPLYEMKSVKLVDMFSIYTDLDVCKKSYNGTVFIGVFLDTPDGSLSRAYKYIVRDWILFTF